MTSGPTAAPLADTIAELALKGVTRARACIG